MSAKNAFASLRSMRFDFQRYIFMVRELTPGATDGVRGTIRYAAPFGAI